MTRSSQEREAPSGMRRTRLYQRDVLLLCLLGQTLERRGLGLQRQHKAPRVIGQTSLLGGCHVAVINAVAHVHELPPRPRLRA